MVLLCQCHLVSALVARLFVHSLLDLACRCFRTAATSENFRYLQPLSFIICGYLVAGRSHNPKVGSSILSCRIFPVAFQMAWLQLLHARSASPHMRGEGNLRVRPALLQVRRLLWRVPDSRGCMSRRIAPKCPLPEMSPVSTAIRFPKAAKVDVEAIPWLCFKRWGVCFGVCQMARDACQDALH